MDKPTVDSKPVGLAFVFHDLPKISLNEWYAGSHWSVRKKLKDKYKALVYKETKYKETKPCECEYIFEFVSHPLDCTNCVAMAKMIEDIILPKDDISIVKSVKLTSLKGTENKVTLLIRWII